MDQATAEADPYNWVFTTNTTGTTGGLYGRGRYGKGLYGRGESTGTAEYYARRRQEHGMIYQYGATLNALLTAITSYEADNASRSNPVSHEWGQLYGGSYAFKAKLISPGG